MSVCTNVVGWGKVVLGGCVLMHSFTDILKDSENNTEIESRTVLVTNVRSFCIIFLLLFTLLVKY